MHQLTQAWLPVLVAAVAVFVASSLIHMLFKWHNAEYRPLANEDEVRAALRAGNAEPGSYVIPHCGDMKKMAEEPMLSKFREGPVGFLTLVRSGPPNIGKSLALWFALNLLVAAVAGCLAVQYVGLGGGRHAAAHLVGVLSLFAYGAGPVQQGIWMGKPGRGVLFDLLDACIYALVSMLAFFWLWP